MSSIVLQPGVKDMLLADCKDFLCSEEWYVGLSFGDFTIAYTLNPGTQSEVINTHTGLGSNNTLSPFIFRKAFPLEEVICCMGFPEG